MGNRIRTVELKVRLTDEENRLLQKKVAASGIKNKSSYVRKMILDGYIIHQDYSALRECTLFHINVNAAKQAPGRHLKYPLRCIIDEIANIGKIPKLDILISTTRKYWIYFELIFQDVSQIKAKYRDDAPIILAVCPIKLFLGGSGEETTKYVSEQLLGKATIDTVSYTGSGTSGSLGKNSYSQNQQKTGRSLLDQTELAQLPKSECIVFVKGYPPFRSKKYDVREHPRYKLLADEDTGGYVFDRNAGRRRTIKQPNYVTTININV